MNTQEHKNTLRTSIYTDEETLTRCRVLFGEAGVTSFSQFVKKAIDCYIERLVAENHSAFLAKEIRQAVRNELRPITARLSKGLYRYAVLLDMLCQIIAYKDTDWNSDDLHDAAITIDYAATSITFTIDKWSRTLQFETVI